MIIFTLTQLKFYSANLPRQLFGDVFNFPSLANFKKRRKYGIADIKKTCNQMPDPEPFLCRRDRTD